MAPSFHVLITALPANEACSGPLPYEQGATVKPTLEDAFLAGLPVVTSRSAGARLQLKLGEPVADSARSHVALRGYLFDRQTLGDERNQVVAIQRHPPSLDEDRSQAPGLWRARQAAEGEGEGV
jgi:hypothetical protein